MPELPEVETVRRGLERRVLGRTISAVELIRPAMMRGGTSGGIQGCRISRLRRKGKVLELGLSRADSRVSACLLVRLGMTGQLVVTAREAPLLPHTHARISLDDCGEELRYRDPRRFGILRFCTPQQAERVFQSLGPDALEITREEFERRLQGRRGAIKGWLLNQQSLAGLGNIYADEALFEARIHPRAAACSISKARARALHGAVQEVLRRAIDCQGTSFRDYIDIEGRPGNFGARLLVYGRENQPCPRCGSTIRRIVVCSRSSHFCPHCQRFRSRTAP
ncbi:MAG: bifunctional DNA-formamidopyrimidine glycosylase/DNA-(apurinic or apyrimidinic site) lyase [Terriglobia bacterium]